MASSKYCTYNFPGLTVLTPTKYPQPMIEVKNTTIGTIHVAAIIPNTCNVVQQVAAVMVARRRIAAAALLSST